MYNRLYKHSNDNNVLYRKQFGFQEKHSTEHAIMQLFDEISYSFEEDLYTLVIFIDLSKAFETVNYKILITKIKSYGTNSKQFKSSFQNRNQLIPYGNFSTSYINTSCGVPQGSIVGPLLFLVYVNDLNKAPHVLNPIMFADDANLCNSHQKIPFSNGKL